MRGRWRSGPHSPSDGCGNDVDELVAKGRGGLYLSFTFSFPCHSSPSPLHGALPSLPLSDTCASWVIKRWSVHYIIISNIYCLVCDRVMDDTPIACLPQVS